MHSQLLITLALYTDLTGSYGQKERMRGLPGVSRRSAASEMGSPGARAGVPAEFLPVGLAADDPRAVAFLQGRALPMRPGALSPPALHAEGTRLPGVPGPVLASFEAAFAERASSGSAPTPSSDVFVAVPPDRAAALRPHLHNFLMPCAAPTLLAKPAPPLAPLEQQRIRDRATIMGRHVHTGTGAGAADARVHNLLASLGIETSPGMLRQTGQEVVAARMEAAFGESSAANRRGGNAGGAWAGEYIHAHAPLSRAPSSAWAGEFAANPGELAANPPPVVSMPERWATEFAAQQQAARDLGGTVSRDAHQTHRLVDTMSREADPRFRSSQFLKFVSKMSHGHGDDSLTAKQQQRSPPSGSWVEEFSKPPNPGAAAVWPESAGGDFVGEGWAGEFANEGDFRDRLAKTFGLQEDGSATDWADDFAGAAPASIEDTDELADTAMARRVKGWAEEFAAGGTPLGATAVPDEMLEQYQEYLSDLNGAETTDLSGRVGEYVFAERNPYAGRRDALAVGRQLFTTGVLSEAVLALEAAVLADPNSSEAWRLLGTVQAENDDDRQAIAAMARALRADPDSREVLLSLGVSHTNELDSAEAADYLRRWLAASPQYAPSAPLVGAPLGEVVATFERVAATHPGDADLHTVVGVLSNLTRDYDRAVAAFKRALELRPDDYSLWNKLGATQANSSRSSEALGAYQRALDAKPNYVRAWSNMGIALANMGNYEDSVRYYARALSMNPGADAVWGYVRISLSCSGRADALAAVEARDLGALQGMFPL